MDVFTLLFGFELAALLLRVVELRGGLLWGVAGCVGRPCITKQHSAAYLHDTVAHPYISGGLLHGCLTNLHITA